MEREEWESAGVCALCGEAVALGRDREFEFGVGNTLCWSCAMERGGQYDADRDAWIVSPAVEDLPDES